MTPVEQQILDFITSHPDATVRKLAVEVGRGARHVQRSLASLVAAGRVEHVPETWRVATSSGDLACRDADVRIGILTAPIADVREVGSPTISIPLDDPSSVSDGIPAVPVVSSRDDEVFTPCDDEDADRWRAQHPPVRSQRDKTDDLTAVVRDRCVANGAQSPYLPMLRLRVRTILENVGNEDLAYVVVMELVDDAGADFDPNPHLADTKIAAMLRAQPDLPDAAWRYQRLWIDLLGVPEDDRSRRLLRSPTGSRTYSYQEVADRLQHWLDELEAARSRGDDEGAAGATANLVSLEASYRLLVEVAS